MRSSSALVESREPFWASVDRDGQRFRVYFLSDRGGIYALGYPVITWVGHLINLAELVMLAAVLYVAADRRIDAVQRADAADSRRAAARCCARCARASTASCSSPSGAGAVVPVFILAIVTRTYFATQLTAGAEEAAARTVTTAQRLVEDYAALQQRGAAALDAIDDQIMVLVRRAIDEDVNLFDRAHAPGDERARSVRVAAAADADAGRRLPRDPARPPADLRRPTRRSATSPTGSPPRRCVPAAARASSPSR